eukprot:11771167-Ditylum_brightwellii.AAC.1
MASPGFLLELHPMLVCKDALMDNLRDSLSSISMPTNQIAEEWKAANWLNWTKTTAPVPFFTVST